MRISTILNLTALLMASGAMADFYIWTVLDVTEDCSSVNTCKPIYGDQTVAAGPTPDNINTDCNSSLDIPAEDDSGKVLSSANGATDFVWFKGVCGVTTYYKCTVDGDSMTCGTTNGDDSNNASCTKPSTGDKETCTVGPSQSYYLTEAWSCTSNVLCL